MGKHKKVLASLVAAATVATGAVTVVGTSTTPAQAAGACILNRTTQRTGLTGSAGVYQAYVFFPRVTPTSKYVYGSRIQRIEVKTHGRSARIFKVTPTVDRNGCLYAVRISATDGGRRVDVVAYRGFRG